MSNQLKSPLKTSRLGPGSRSNSSTMRRSAGRLPYTPPATYSVSQCSAGAPARLAGA